MQQLIPIIQTGGQPSVNARDLHAFLEVGKDFSNWIKDRIEQFGFLEGEDFSPISARSPAGRITKDYLLSLDMSKELSMVERNDKGKQARQYFIACEKALRGGGFKIPQTMSEALQLAADQSRLLELKEEELFKIREDLSEVSFRLASTSGQLESKKIDLELQAPKVEFYDTVTESATVCQMAVACQTAGLPFGRNTLFQKLREEGVLVTGGSRHNLPKQVYVTTQKLFTVKEHNVENPKTGEPIVSFTTYVTQKGLDWLIRRFKGTPQKD